MTVKSEALKEEQRELLLAIVELEMACEGLFPHLREVAYFLPTLIERHPELFPMALEEVKKEHLNTHPSLLSTDDKVRLAAVDARGDLWDVQAAAGAIVKILEKYVK